MIRTALLAAATLAACTPAAQPPPKDPRVAQLEARVAQLEERLKKPSDPELTDLAHRIDDLETLAREEHQLQQDIQALIARIAERAAASPAPLAATPRGDGLDPARRYKIAIAGSPTFGPPDAAVTIVAAVQVPERFTHLVWPALRAVRAKYGDDVRVVVEGFLANPQALPTTLAACAAARQSAELLDRLEDALWTQRELAQTDPAKPWPDADDARTAASGAGLDLAKYDAALPGCAKDVDREQRALALVGQTAAPTLWINGRPFVGAKSAEQLGAIVDDELAKAKADRAGGGAARTYYDRLMKTALSSAR